MTAFHKILVILVFGCLSAAIVAWTEILGAYGQFIVTSLAFTAVATLSVSFLAGLTGIWSLGNAAFMAVAAYGSANLMRVGVPIEATILIAALVCAAMGYVLGLCAGRFSILYFGLLTLALSLTATEVVLRWTDMTGGENGLHVPSIRLLVSSQPLSLQSGTVLSILISTSAFLLVTLFAYGRRRRVWLAVKSQRTAATALGLKPHKENATAFAFSAAIASLAGIGIMLALSFLDASAFNLDAGVRLIVATVVGGIGSMAGALVGGFFVVLVPELSRGLPAAASLVFGVSVVGILLFMRKGVVPSVVDLLRHRPAVPEVKAKAIDENAMADLVARYAVPAKDALVIKGVTVQFGGLKALDKVSLEIQPGVAVGLIGPNGAGKSTLLNVLSGFYRPSAKQVMTFGGHELDKLQTYDRAAIGMGRTFQHAELFKELTIRDTITLAAEMGAEWRRSKGVESKPADAAAAELLEGLGLLAYADLLPSELPFGIQKVADMARTIALGSSFVAMDEPFSGMDRDERLAIRSIVRGMTRAGVSVLLIDHDVEEVLGLVSRVTVLDFGRVLMEGEPHKVRNDPEVARAYFGAGVERSTRQCAVDQTADIALQGSGIKHRYDGVRAIESIDFHARKGEFVAVLGVNGSGKSTLSAILSGIQRPSEGVVRVFGNDKRGRAGGQSFVQDGVTLVPEGRRLFGQLSVWENLRLGGYALPRTEAAERIARVLDLMPKTVRENSDRAAVTFSGGEQQMIAIGRALMANPRVLLVDEPSLGLAPILIAQVYELLAQLRAEQGVTVIVFEQLATYAMKYADRIVIVDSGTVFFEGTTSDEKTMAALKEGYLGAHKEEAEPVAAAQ